MRIASLKKFESSEYIKKISEANSRGMPVVVLDITTGEETNYHAIKAAARALSVDRRYIENYIYLKQDTPVLGKYTFKLVEI